jgi:hypothetical protein
MTDAADTWDPALATRQLRCERCGTVFGCRNLGETGSCWCSMEAFQLPMPLPENAGPFEDCLCPTCLRAIAAELQSKGHGPAGPDQR